LGGLGHPTPLGLIEPPTGEKKKIDVQLLLPEEKFAKVPQTVETGISICDEDAVYQPPHSHVLGNLLRQAG